MELTSPQYSYGLSATVTPSSVYSSGTITLGIANTTATYADGLVPDIAYGLFMQIADGDYLGLDMETGEVTNQSAGSYQLETATVIAGSGITGNGNATCVFTSALVTGSPLTVSVPVTTALNAENLVTTAIRTALQSTAAITAHYDIGGTGSAITAAALVKAQNDATLNISTANGTCTGITTSSTSTDTTAGASDNKAYRIDGKTWDQTDFEGNDLPLASKLYSVLIKSDNSSRLTIQDGVTSEQIQFPGIAQKICTNGDHTWISNPVVTFTATGDLTISLIVHAGE